LRCKGSDHVVQRDDPVQNPALVPIRAEYLILGTLRIHPSRKVRVSAYGTHPARQAFLFCTAHAGNLHVPDPANGTCGNALCRQGFDSLQL
jgi:hypothetical protein